MHARQQLVDDLDRGALPDVGPDAIGLGGHRFQHRGQRVEGRIGARSHHGHRPLRGLGGPARHRRVQHQDAARGQIGAKGARIIRRLGAADHDRAAGCDAVGHAPLPQDHLTRLRAVHHQHDHRVEIAAKARDAIRHALGPLGRKGVAAPRIQVDAAGGQSGTQAGQRRPHAHGPKAYDAYSIAGRDGHLCFSLIRLGRSQSQTRAQCNNLSQ